MVLECGALVLEALEFIKDGKGKVTQGRGRKRRTKMENDLEREKRGTEAKGMRDGILKQETVFLLER